MTGKQLLSLAWRESRFARKKLFLFLSAISLGVAALVAVKGFAANMQREVRDQARGMLGADVSLSSRRPFSPRIEVLLDSLAAADVEIVRVTSFASMALHRETGATRLVQVRAPEPGFPIYGEIETEPAGQWATLHEGRNIIVEPSLLVALGAQIGDSVSVGSARFRITGEIRKLPGDIEVASSFAPRVFFRETSLEETELLGYGARIEYEAFLRIPDPTVAEAFVDDYRPVFRAERVGADTIEEVQEDMGEALGQLADFLGLIGVFALLLGGIGVASAMGAYMARKADSVAVLRCLGATARQVLGIYILQAAVMGLAGALLGVALGAGAQWILPRMLEGLLPVDVQIRPDGMAIVMGLAVGLWTAVAFALLPLLQVRQVSPLSALRRRVEPLRVTGLDPWRITVWIALAASVLVLVLYQAGEADVGFSIAGGIAGTLLALWLTAHGAARLTRRLPRSALVYTVRQGVANLHRPGNQTVTVVLALGFGAFLIATLSLTQTNILRPLNVDAEGRGNLLLFDIQEDQLDGVFEELVARDLAVMQSVAIVPMRVAAVNGAPVRRPAGSDDADDFDPDEFRDETGGAPAVDAEAEVEAGAYRGTQTEPAGKGEERAPGGWAVRREYRSTYRDTINSSERLVAGRWWEPGRQGPRDTYEISLDRGIAEDLGVGIGGRVDWDVQGVHVPTVVTSLREIEWARFEPNFFAVFEPAALRGAPQMWVLLARADSALDRALVQRDIVSRYPNVAAIDLTLLQRAVDDVLGRVALVIRFLAGFSVVTGFIVLLGAVATGRLQRIRESVLLKTLGATRRQIGAILFTEYALLGLLSVIVGCSLALAAGWGLARWLFDVSFGVEPLPLLGLAASIALLSALLGLSASREVFRSTPMEAIREE